MFIKTRVKQGQSQDSRAQTLRVAEALTLGPSSRAFWSGWEVEQLRQEPLYFQDAGLADGSSTSNIKMVAPKCCSKEIVQCCYLFFWIVLPPTKFPTAHNLLMPSYWESSVFIVILCFWVLNYAHLPCILVTLWSQCLGIEVWGDCQTDHSQLAKGGAWIGCPKFF